MNPLRAASVAALSMILAGCPDYEGPIDVILVDLDETAEVTWAEADSDDFVPCENATTDPEATVGCGPHGVGTPGDYVVRVTWMGVDVEQRVTLERDRSYQANVALTFAAADFEP